MEGCRVKSLSVIAGGVVACISVVALAQGPAGGNVLEEVVVTGTPGGGEILKLDASYAITNINEEDIAKFSPKSTADLLKTVPGRDYRTR